MRDILVKLSDKFDREGKLDLADAVDGLLLTAARPKAPLKSLDEDVKKDLLKFIHNVKTNLDNSMKSLEEFFRRLRYFDIGETVKDLRLDKALRELARINSSIDAAGRSMYALTYGKNPSRADLDQLAEDFGSGKEETGSPLEFFESQNKEDVEPELEEDVGLEEQSEETMPDEEDLGYLEDEEYADFMRSLEEYREGSLDEEDEDFAGSADGLGAFEDEDEEE